MFLRFRKMNLQVLPGRVYQRQRLGHAFLGGGAPAMEPVCHGPLGWGQRSSLSSFRTTLVERHHDHFLVCCRYSPIRVYLSSPSALHSLPPQPTPTLLDPSQLKGLMAFWRNITRGIKTYCLSKLILRLPCWYYPPSTRMQSISMMIGTRQSHHCI